MNQAKFSALNPQAEINSDDRMNFSVPVLTQAIEAVLGTEEAADTLLGISGLLGRNLYSEKQLSRKMRNEDKQLPQADIASMSSDTAGWIVEHIIDGLISSANLKPMQEICFRLHAGGMSRRSIAQSLGLSCHRISRHLKIALKKIRTAYFEDKYAGWYEVYLSEVNRPIYRRRK